MKILKINPDNPEKEKVDAAADIIKKGGIVVYPTDTVYGLGTDAFNEKAVEKIFQIKKRDFRKPFSVIVKDLKMIENIAVINEKIQKFLKIILPGRITLVLYKKSIVPDILTGGSSKIGIRIPNYKFTQFLMQRLNFPLVTTSANVSTRPVSGDIRDVLGQFKKERDKLDLVVDAGRLPKSQPSTVLDLTFSEPKILRVGPVKKDELWSILKKAGLIS